MMKREDIRTGEYCPICQGDMVRDGLHGVDYCSCGHEVAWATLDEIVTMMADRFLHRKATIGELRAAVKVAKGE